MKISFYIFFIFVFFVSCKKDPCLITEPDPCLNEQVVNANFDVYEAHYLDFNGEGLIIKSDTVMTKNHIILIANEQNADIYTWIINGNIFNGRKISYQANDSSKVDTVTLIVNKTPSNCFPNDDGIDTITKHIVTIPWSQWSFNGEYLGHLSHESSLDTFRIKIEVIPSILSPGYMSELHITGLDGNNCFLNAGNYCKLYYKFFNYSVNWIPCNSLFGYAIQPSGTSSIKFDYQSMPNQSETTDITFNGFKL